MAFIEPPFDNLCLRPGAPSPNVQGHGSFGRTLAMKTESVGHHAATQALVLSMAGVMAIMLVASLILLILY
jgi:hypothetical protein